MGIYSIYFAASGTPAEGLTPAFKAGKLRRLDTKALIDLTGTSFDEVGDGSYKLIVGLPLATVLQSSPVQGVVDGGSGLDNAIDRYKAVRLNIDDFGALGPGAKHVELDIEDTNTNPIPAAKVWITTGTDSQTQVVAGPIYADAFGVVTFMLDPNVDTPVAITGVTNASPIVVTAPAHLLSSGNDVLIEGVLGNTAANGKWVVTVINANTFSLNGSVGNAAYTSGGTSQKYRPYYRWAKKEGVRFSNPQKFVVD